MIVSQVGNKPTQYAPRPLGGAPSKKSVKQRGKTSCPKLNQKLNATTLSKINLRTKRKVTTRSLSQLKTITRATKSTQAFQALSQKENISPEAKGVYTAAAVILGKVARCKTFSAENIKKAIIEGLEKVNENKGTLKGTVALYDAQEDGEAYKSNEQKKSTHGTSALKGLTKWDQEKEKPIAKVEGTNEGIKLCKKIGIDGRTELPQKEALPNPQNPTNIKIDFSSSKKTEGENKISYSFCFKNEKSEEKTVQDLTITCPEDFKIENYNKQLEREINTYSKNVSIHQLEPGTVLVRVFGKEQSIMSSCWCNANDNTSAVTEAKDLYNTLAVKPEWNGDGNLGIFVVPEGVNIYVAEGKIASQIGTYAEYQTETTDKSINGEKQTKISEKSYYYVFEGGGTQLNILTPNDNDNFAGVTNQKIFKQTMFVFRDDEMINPEKLTIE